MILSDSVIFRAKKGTVTDLQIHATIFGAFSDEIKDGEQISSFVGIGSKNYAYETMKKDTKEKVKQVVKVKGLTLSSGDAQEKMDINLMREFVHQIQQEKTVSTTVSQFRLVIDGVTKQINAKEMDVVFKNYSNIKRFYNPEASKNQLWAYGVTKYD